MAPPAEPPAVLPPPLAKECLGVIGTTHDALLTLRICQAILRPALVRDLLLQVAGDLPDGHARLLLERAADSIASGGQTDTTMGRIEQAIELLKEGNP